MGVELGEEREEVGRDQRLVCRQQLEHGHLGIVPHLVYVLGLRVWELGSRFWGLGLRVWGSGFRV